MKNAWPRVGMWKSPAMGVLWREPKTGGLTNQASNLVTVVAGKGIKRRSEQAMGIAAPVTTSMILRKQIRISSSQILGR